MYTPPEDADDSSDVTRYKVMVMKVHQWQPFQPSDIALNNIRHGGVKTRVSIPDFVTNFERMLDTKPGLRPDIPLSLSPPTWAAYFELREDSTVRDEPCEETQQPQPLRYAEKLEALHIASVVSFDWEELWNGHRKCILPVNECLAYSMFIQFLCVPTNRTTTVHHDTYVITYML